MIDSSKRSLQVSFRVKGAKLGLGTENSGPAQRTLTVRDLSKLVWEQKTLSLPRKISGSTSKLSWRQKTFNLPRNTPKGACGSLASRQKMNLQAQHPAFMLADPASHSGPWLIGGDDASAPRFNACTQATSLFSLTGSRAWLPFYRGSRNDTLQYIHIKYIIYEL